MRKPHVIRLTPTDTLELAARVRMARTASGMTQSDLAHALGVSQTAVSRIESAERALGLLEALAIASAVGVSLNELLPSRLQPLASS